MGPLRHKLADGDTVEILTSPSQAPSKDWLDFVVSGKARSKIRHAIRVAENARSRELGRDLLERELRRAGLSLARLLESGELVEPARKWARGSSTTCSPRVGYGRWPRRDVVRALRPDWQEPEAAAGEPARLRSIFAAREALLGERHPRGRAGRRDGALRRAAARRCRATRSSAS